MTQAQANTLIVCAAQKRAVITAFAMCGSGHLVAG
jgi:hypothetical protein